MTGFKSVFSFELKDRVWMFYCCPVADTLIDCKNSYFLTDDYEEDFSFDIPQGYIISMALKVFTVFQISLGKDITMKGIDYILFT